MKTVRSILLVLLAARSFSGLAQDKYYLSAMAFQEFDMLSRNRPFGVSTFNIFHGLLLQADYRHNVAQTTEVQIIPSRDSYGGKIGYMKNAGFAVGVEKVQTLKTLHFDINEEPADVNGDRVENLYKVNSLLGYTQFSLGFHFMTITKGAKNMELMMDDFDIKMNKDKMRYSVVTFSLEMLYSPKIEHSNSFSYSPFGAYIPKELYFSVPVKEKHWGCKLRVEYTSATKLGVIIDMGVFPGISHKTSNYNDFNFGAKFGVVANMSMFDH